MKRIPVAAQLACAALVVAPIIAYAQTIRRVTWANLAPKQTPYINPFDKLSDDDFQDIVILARLRDLQKAKIKPDKPQLDSAAKARANLTRRKVPFEKLLNERDKIMEERKHELTTTTKSLENQIVEISGYLLPLEFEGTRVSEFLLVPWVGACIHTPPPPPNQIIFVHGNRAIDVEDKFIPVKVTGRLTGKPLSKELFLVDGSASISIGYSLQASKAEIVR